MMSDGLLGRLWRVRLCARACFYQVDEMQG